MNDVNAAGGVHGRKLEFVGGDDGYNNASVGLGTAKALADEVLGFTTVGINGGTTVAPFANEKGIPLLALNVTKDTVKGTRTVFPASTYFEDSAGILASFVKNRLRLGKKRIGIIYQTDKAVGGAREDFKREGRRFNLRVVVEQPVEATPSSCVNQVTALQSKEADVAVMFASPVAAARCLLDARTIGYRPTWTGPGRSWDANLTTTASNGATEGIKMVTAAKTLETPEGRRYQQAARKYYADDSDVADDDIALLVWGQVYVWAEALERAGPNLTRQGFI